MVNIKKFPKVFAVVSILSVTFIACSRDVLSEDQLPLLQVEKSNDVVPFSYPCTAGFRVEDYGNYLNIGGGGAVALDASYQSFPGTTDILIQQGVLYGIKRTKAQLSNSTSFTIQNGGSGDIMVRVVGKTTSNNYLTLVTAKRVLADRGHISIKVCDINNFSYIKEVYFQVYGLESSAANNVTFVN